MLLGDRRQQMCEKAFDYVLSVRASPARVQQTDKQHQQADRPRVRAG